MVVKGIMRRRITLKDLIEDDMFVPTFEKVFPYGITISSIERMLTYMINKNSN